MSKPVIPALWGWGRKIAVSSRPAYATGWVYRFYQKKKKKKTLAKRGSK